MLDQLQKPLEATTEDIDSIVAARELTREDFDALFADESRIATAWEVVDPS
ncbi:hypothetical protein SAMN05428945_1079 [Streptomyces sp. 2224.1]|uniref:hypothetical protein n=1 Tax=unclassified Streptomyces TaxID=2593676 RepID=UPI0008803EA3|nr:MULTISPECIES: hypothetical protein [unclassified Streptomyces]PBC84312.1 hypothetical protein BX261_4298 [Streptomyces sp. 2321.6]SDR32489.1 hypothetical protein SAMN05216511_2901 [Streptomyces sp. KS_16]SEB75835.1 hypothetical protein SAMN05428945_1079 [Streptomyces sp. 2224.1]SED26967.1 hypothetical protein SAMN05428940_4325 [Streptomyces sp. 2133.1]SEE56472.1 hypothetical protein SAMN05428954_3009 [Streptomyces sp. 2112.3]